MPLALEIAILGDRCALNAWSIIFHLALDAHLGEIPEVPNDINSLSLDAFGTSFMPLTMVHTPKALEGIMSA